MGRVCPLIAMGITYILPKQFDNPSPVQVPFSPLFWLGDSVPPKIGDQKKLVPTYSILSNLEDLDQCLDVRQGAE